MSDARVGSVIFSVAEPAELRSHYQALLGSEPRFSDGDRFVAFDVGGSMVALARADEAPAATAPGALLSLEVDDIYVWAAAARERGVPVGLIWTQAHELVATVEDPAGNHLAVYSRPAHE